MHDVKVMMSFHLGNMKPFPRSTYSTVICSMEYNSECAEGG